MTRQSRAWRIGGRERAAAIALGALGVSLAAFAPDFFAPANLRDVVLANAAVLVMAVGMTVLILTAQIDVSIGAQFAICAVVGAVLAREGAPMPLVLAAAILTGGMLGAVNGWLVVGLRLPSIVATLATLVILRDGLRWLTEGAWISALPASFQWAGLGQETGQVALMAAAIAIAALAGWGLHALAAGRAVYATGSDAEAARLTGLSPDRVIFGAFVLSGAVAGAAAMLNAIRFAQVPSTVPVGIELKVIAAVVVGGAAITGGRGSIAGTVLGVALLGTIGTGLTFLGVSAYWERALQGAIILAAILSDRAITTGAIRAGSEARAH